MEHVNCNIRRDYLDHVIVLNNRHETVGNLMGYLPLAKDIEAFWFDPVNQEAETWKEHLDINTVMLTTSLAPDGFLTV